MKHGGGMDRVDSFRVSDAELIKWEKGCKLLKSASSTSSGGAIELLPVSSKDIQHELTSKNIVLPLRGYKVYPQELNGTTEAGSVPHAAAALSAGLQRNMGFQDMCSTQGSTSLTDEQPMGPSNNGKVSAVLSLTNGMVGQTRSGGDCTRVLQKFTQISNGAEGCQANVHTGALPPWLEASEEKKISQLNTGPYLNKLTISSGQTGKSRKLNPKRVGAAWAERRRVELEMEKRGEKLPNTVDANWLPNFGRVWQGGTQKESRKEFEMEKRKFPKDENQPDLSFKIQPYISKRMRTGSPFSDSTGSGCVKDIPNTL